MNDLNQLQKKIRALADTVNVFKSEAVQLRVINILLAEIGIGAGGVAAAVAREVAPAAAPRKRGRPAGAAKPAAAKRAARKGAATPGAYAMISSLYDKGYFSSGRTLSAVVDRLHTLTGRTYKASECSPALLRFFRDRKLKRKKNVKGQYEYAQS